jgi:hypothetical protein
MKSSALALATAAALMFGATSLSFAQDASTTTSSGTATTAEECLILQDAGATPPGESLVNDQENDSDGEAGDNGEDDGDTSAELAGSSDSTDATGAVDDTTPSDCPEVNETDEE